MALRLSGRIQETRECLAAVAGSWNSLAQQVLGFILSGDFPRGKQALDETLLGLAGAVQVAGGIASTACSRENPNPSHVQESFLQLQAKFSHAELNTKGFLEKAVSFRESCGMEKAMLELHGVRWAIGMRVLLDAMDQFVGRDVLFLRELSRAVRNKVGPRSLLAAVAENSLRLQEAARLSFLSCPGDHGAREILALREEIQVLMEALLDVSNTLLHSPLPTASLATRFELLQRDVALRAKALLLHLERVNKKQLQLIQDVVGAALSDLPQEERQRSKEGFEEKANQLLADVQRVRNTLQGALGAGAQLTSQPDLLSMADHLLLLTADVVGSAWRHFQSHQDPGDPHLEGMVWYWSAKAHYLVTQLWGIHGIDRDTLRCLTECLQRERSPGSPSSTAGLSPAPEPPEAAGIHPCRSRGVSGAVQDVRELVWELFSLAGCWSGLSVIPGAPSTEQECWQGLWRSAGRPWATQAAQVAGSPGFLDIRSARLSYIHPNPFQRQRGCSSPSPPHILSGNTSNSIPMGFRSWERLWHRPRSLSKVL
ncbi:uncharacterized protein LOC134416267 isoform X1 [Melospiza melodia melodia]|uniref:uncharacterized protein LOC134416267 isoform X1 n=1 Tax=Melospiza melodia melodia TaxID=1914991 RepID=UPI002FD23CBE